MSTYRDKNGCLVAPTRERRKNWANDGKKSRAEKYINKKRNYIIMKRLKNNVWVIIKKQENVGTTRALECPVVFESVCEV